MLRSLRIRNFKSWEDTKAIGLAPLTLFFGTNSSGKSSIGQFLILLKQTAASPDRRTVLFGGDKSTPVNLGSFKDFVHRHQADRKLSFEIEWKARSEMAIRDSRNKHDFKADTLRFAASIGIPDSASKVPNVESLEFSLLQTESGSVEMGLGMKRKDVGNKYTLVHHNYQAIRRAGRKWDLVAPSRFYGFPDEVAAYYQNLDFAQDFSLEMEKLLNRICYLGPLRDRASRLYTWSGSEPSDVGFEGKEWIGALLAARAQKRMLNFKVRGALKPFEQVIAESLLKLGIVSDFKVESVADERREYEVKIKTPGASDWIDLIDVGFGVSQVLPFIVQAFYAPPGSIILVEQPELHLHPKAQTNLADVIIDIVNARENEAPRSIQLIIESHSEHFLRRIQTRIAENSISSKQVAAYFSHVNDGSSHLDPLRIDLLGNIDNWPRDFFGDTLAEALALTRAQARHSRVAVE